MEEFDGDLAVEFSIERGHHYAHTATSDGVKYRVAPNAGSRIDLGVGIMACIRIWSRGLVGQDRDIMDAVASDGQAKRSGELQRLVRRVVLRMTAVDGVIHDDELVRIRWLLGRLQGHTPTEEELRADLASLEPQATLYDDLAQVRATLSIAERGELVRAAFVVASADGKIKDAEDALMVDIARALDISPEQYRGLLGQIMLTEQL